MAIEAARLSVKVDAETKDAESGVSRVHSLLGGLGGAFKNVAGIAGGFVLGQGLLNAPRKLLDLAQGAADDAASMGRLQQAVTNAEGSFNGWGQQIDNAISSGQRLAFTDDDIRDSLSIMTAQTGDADEAMHRLGTAQDLARGAGIDLVSASKLLGKVTDETVGPLKRMGIQVEKGATAQEVLNAVDAKFGGQAGKFAETAAGQWAVAKIRMSEAGESLGALLLPLFTKLANFLAQVAVPALQAFIDAVGPRLTSAIDSVVGVLGGLWPLITRVAGFLSGAFNSAWVLVRDAVITFKDALSGDWANSDQIAPLHRILGELGLLINSVVVPAWDALKGALAAVSPYWDTIKTALGAILTILSGPTIAAIMGMVRGFGKDGLAGVLPGAIEGLKKFGEAFLTLGGIVLDALKGVDWGALFGGLKDAVGGVDWAGIASDVGTALLDALDTLSGLAWDVGAWIIARITSVDWGGLAGTVGQGLLDALDAATGLAWDIGAWIIGRITSVDWTGLASTIGGGLLTALTTVTGLAWDAGAWLVARVTAVDWSGLATTIGKGILSALGKVAGLGWDAAKWIARTVTGTNWSDVAHSIANGIGAAISGLADAGAWVYGWVRKGLDSVSWDGVASSIAGGIGATWGALTSAAVYIYDWIAGGISNVNWAGLAGSISGELGTALSTVSESTGTTNTQLLAITASIGTIIGALSLLPGPLTASFGALGAMISGVYLEIATGPGILAGIVTVLGGPVTLTIAAVIALLAAFGLAYATNFGGVRDITNEVAGAVATAFGAMMTAIQPFTDIIGPALVSIWGTIKTTFDQVMAAVTGATPLWTQLSELWTNMQPVLSVLGTVLQTIGMILGGVLLVAITGLVTGLKVLAPILGTTIVVAVNLVIGALTSLVAALNTIIVFWTNVVKVINDLVHGDWSAAWNDAKALVQGLVDGVSAILGGLPSVVAGYFADLALAALGALQGLATDAGAAVSGMVDSILGFFQTLWSEAQGKVSGMVGEITGTIGGFVTSVVQFFADLVTGALDQAQNLWTSLVTTFGNIYTEVTTKVAELVTEAVRLVGTLPGRALDAVGSLLGTLSSAGSDLIQGLIDGITGRLGDLIGALDSVKSTITDHLPDIPGFSPIDHYGQWVGEQLVGGVAEGIRIRIPETQAAVVSLTQAIQDSANAGINAAHTQFTVSGQVLAQALVDGIIAGASSAGDAVAYVSDSVALALDTMQQDLLGKIDLAKISGADPESIAKLQAQLDAVTGVLSQWATDMGITVTEALDSTKIDAAVNAQWTAVLGNLDSIINGSARETLLASIATLNQQMAFAVAAGAPQAVIDGLTASLAAAQAQLTLVGQEYATALQAGLVDSITPDYLQGIADKTGAILDGSLIPQLQEQLDKLNQVIAFGTAQGWSAEVLAAFQAQADQLGADLEGVMSAAGVAAAAGLLSPEAQAAWDKAAGVVTQHTLEQFRAMLPQLKDFGVSFIDEIAAGVQDGTVSMDDALAAFTDMVTASLSDLDATNDLAVDDIIAQLQRLEEQLTGDLAQAFIDGTDPTAINANLAIIEQLLLALAPTVDAASQYFKELGGYLNETAAAMGNVAAGAKTLKDALNNISDGGSFAAPGGAFGTTTPGGSGGAPVMIGAGSAGQSSPVTINQTNYITAESAAEAAMRQRLQAWQLAQELAANGFS